MVYFFSEAWKRLKKNKRFKKHSKLSAREDAAIGNAYAHQSNRTFMGPLSVAPKPYGATASLFVLKHCKAAWLNLSVGAFDEAARQSQLENDVMCWAAASALSGETALALRTIEGFVISVCVALYERVMHPSALNEKLARRANVNMMSWIYSEKDAARTIGKNYSVDNDTLCAVVKDASIVLNWDLVRRWFIIALFLHDEEYEVPKNVWFRYFFALFPCIDSKQALHKNKCDKEYIKKEMICRPMNSEAVQEVLLGDCESYDVSLITTITAFKKRHYRTAITHATAFHRVDDVSADCTDSNMHTLTRFMRCMCFLQIGERVMAAEDAQNMLQNNEKLIATAGAAILAFVLPLTQAVSLVTGYEGSIMERRYVYALCEYVHALTLLQLGSMEAAIAVIESAVSLAPRNDVGIWLQDLLVVACTALEDSFTILHTTLSTEQELYIAMAPTFFGGISANCARTFMRTPAGRLLYPKRIPSYASVRHTLPFRMNRAHQRMLDDDYLGAWEDACVAVGCADEIIGSVEFAFTSCSPLNVYAFACELGNQLLQAVLDAAIEDFPKGSDDESGSDGDFVSTLTKDSERIKQLSKSGWIEKEVIKKCFEWAERICQFHPNVRLGRIMRAKYSAAVHEKNFISGAIYIARRYPRSVIAQTTLTYALYANHHIPEAVDSAATALQDFPAAAPAIAMQRVLRAKCYTYYFNYRTLVPVRYAPGVNRTWTKRSVVVMFLLFVNFVIVVMTMVLNWINKVSIPGEAIELAVRLQLPSVIPLFIAVVLIAYSLLGALLSRNLLRTMIQDLCFVDTRLNRFLFGTRGLAFVNVFNALQITIAGNNFLFGSFWYTTLLYLILSILFVPFTTRVWFLPSIHEPKAGIWTWLTLLGVDYATAFIVIIPHIILIALEPLMFIIFFFFLPVQRPDCNTVSRHINKRLELHQSFLQRMPSRYTAGSGSRFPHVLAMSLLYYKTHPDIATKFLPDAQMEEDNCRVFPLIEVYDKISTEPIRCNSYKKKTRSFKEKVGAAFQPLKSVVKNEKNTNGSQGS